MATCEMKEPRETLRGSGPCDISYQVMRRSGKPNWWCHRHGMDASAPDGNPVEACPGSWFDPVPDELQLDLDLEHDQVAIWGAVGAGIVLGLAPEEAGKVHVHRRPAHGGDKDIDGSFDIVRLHNGERRLVVEGTAAVAYSISELVGQDVKTLACPHCGGLHIDEFKFATHGHSKHLCNSCGRNFRDSSGPSISNPLADSHFQLGLDPPPSPVRPDRPLKFEVREYSALRVWPSNTAIVSTMSRTEDVGFHVHAWDNDGHQVLDDTYSSLNIGGTELIEEDLRALTVQLLLVAGHKERIKSLKCSKCGHSLTSPTSGWMEPTTTHECAACGSTTKTQRKVFLNPIAEVNWWS